MLKSFNKTVDALPLSGKYAIQPSMKGYISSGRNGERTKLAGVTTLLGAYVVLHAVQAAMGYEAMTSHLEHAGSSIGEATDGVRSVVDGTYMAVNAAVTVRQAELMHTLHKIRMRKKERRQTQQAAVLARQSIADQDPLKADTAANRAVVRTLEREPALLRKAEQSVPHTVPIDSVKADIAANFDAIRMIDTKPGKQTLRPSGTYDPVAEDIADNAAAVKNFESELISHIDQSIEPRSLRDRLRIGERTKRIVQARNFALGFTIAGQCIFLESAYDASAGNEQLTCVADAQDSLLRIQEAQASGAEFREYDGESERTVSYDEFRANYAQSCDVDPSALG